MSVLQLILRGEEAVGKDQGSYTEVSQLPILICWHGARDLQHHCIWALVVDNVRVVLDTGSPRDVTKAVDRSDHVASAAQGHRPVTLYMTSVKQIALDRVIVLSHFCSRPLTV